MNNEEIKNAVDQPAIVAMPADFTLDSISRARREGWRIAAQIASFLNPTYAAECTLNVKRERLLEAIARTHSNRLGFNINVTEQWTVLDEYARRHFEAYTGTNLEAISSLEKNIKLNPQCLPDMPISFILDVNSKIRREAWRIVVQLISLLYPQYAPAYELHVKRERLFEAIAHAQYQQFGIMINVTDQWADLQRYAQANIAEYSTANAETMSLITQTVEANPESLQPFVSMDVEPQPQEPAQENKLAAEIQQFRESLAVTVAQPLLVEEEGRDFVLVGPQGTCTSSVTSTESITPSNTISSLSLKSHKF